MLARSREVETKADTESNCCRDERNTESSALLDLNALRDSRHIAFGGDDVLLVSRFAHIAIVCGGTEDDVSLLYPAIFPRCLDYNAGEIASVDPWVAGLAEAVVCAFPVDWVESNGKSLD